MQIERVSFGDPFFMLFSLSCYKIRSTMLRTCLHRGYDNENSYTEQTFSRKCRVPHAHSFSPVCYRRLAICRTFSEDVEMFALESERLSIPSAICFSVIKICSLEFVNCPTYFRIS